MKPRHYIRALTLTVALALCATSASYGDGTEPAATKTGKAFAKRGPTESGIPRFAEVCPGLSRGGDPGEVGIRYLHDHGFKTVVSFLADKDESLRVVNSGMRWVHIPMHSWFFSADSPTQDQVRQFFAVVRDSTQYPVFMHCKAGKDRTGCMSALYRIEACGWTKDEALEEMDSFGFAGRYKGLRQFVMNYTKSSGTAVASTSTAPPHDSTVADGTPVPVAPSGAVNVSSPSSPSSP